MNAVKYAQMYELLNEAVAHRADDDDETEWYVLMGAARVARKRYMRERHPDTAPVVRDPDAWDAVAKACK